MERAGRKHLNLLVATSAGAILGQDRPRVQEPRRCLPRQGQLEARRTTKSPFRPTATTAP